MCEGESLSSRAEAETGGGNQQNVTNQSLTRRRDDDHMTANPRLTHLLELADKGPALRAALAEEVAALLMDWPADCPAEMRPVFENLLSKTAREVDADTRARLRVQLFADRQLAARLLPREQNPVTPLLETARNGGNVAAALAVLLGVDEARAQEILGDASGQALALACKGAGLNRAAYSTLALLALPHGENPAARLAAHDSVTTLEAARTLRAWRGVLLPAAAE